MNVKLLDHNKKPTREIIKAFKEGKNSVLYTAATSSGKSYVFLKIVEKLFPIGKILYIVPKHVIAEYLKSNPYFRYIQNRVDFVTYNVFTDITGKSIVENYSFIVIDEAHHIGSDVYGFNIRALIELYKETSKFWLGLTATPDRDSDAINVSEYFDVTVEGIDTFEMIEKGIMPPIEYISCDPETAEILKENSVKIDYDDSESLIKDIVDTNRKKKWFVYFASIADLEEAKPMVLRIFSDYNIFELHSDLDNTKEIYEELQKDQKVVIMNCSMLLEGVHINGVEGVLLLRRVHSITVFKQIIGRISNVGRKDSPLFIDCTGTAYRVGDKLDKDKKYSYLIEDEDRIENENRKEKAIFYVSLKNKKFIDIQELLYRIKSNTFIFRGKEYNSVKQACEEYDANPNTVYSYIFKNKCSKQEAIEYAIRKKAEKFIFRGKEYNSVKQACEEYDADPNTVYSYISKNKCSKQEAIEYAIRKGKKEKFIFRGKEYNSVKQACEEYDVSYRTILDYASKNKCSKQEAIEYAIRKKAEKFIFRGKEYNSFRQACKEYGVKLSTVCSYISRNECSKQEAIEYAIHKKAEKFIFRGKEYNSVKQACEEYDVSYRTILDYASKNKCSKQEAMEYYLRNF